MAIKLKKYSRSPAAKIAAYAALIICICLVSGLLSEFIYAYNSDLESLIKEQYYNSNAYYNEVAQALSATCELMQLSPDAAVPKYDYYYYASYTVRASEYANFGLAERQSFCGYMYGWRNGQLFATRLNNGVEQPLPWEDNGVLSFLETRMGSYSAELLAESTVYVVFTEQLIAQRQQTWEYERADLLNSVERLLAVLLIIVPLMIYLGLVTGRKPEDDELHPGNLDRIYSDVLLLMFLAVVVGGCVLWLNFVETVRTQIYHGSSDIPLETRQLLGIASIIYIGALVWLSLLLLNTLIRKVKAHRALKHSLVYALLRLLALPMPVLWRVVCGQAGKVSDWCGDTWDLLFVGPDYGQSDPAESLFRRQRRFLIVSAVVMVLLIVFLLLNIVPMFLLTLLAECAFAYYFLRDNQRDMESVKQSVEHSLDEQIKSEKLKIDLVANVSHDLKTPLTSIISYVELLDKEDNLSPAARDYVQVLGEKSRRLDHIVSDLFELSKATSGNIPLDMDLLDLKRLFAQTLADMGDMIEASGMDIRLRLPEQPLMVCADGNKLYRVLQNVLDNALKYSLTGSRIYVELYEEDGRAVGAVKNTASYEMNFTSEDIMQRFNRGDSARSSEGSGLGLAIAKSFCERCGGLFSVSVDGDQFKASIDFPLA